MVQKIREAVKQAVKEQATSNKWKQKSQEHACHGLQNNCTQKDKKIVTLNSKDAV